ncbi:MAG: hypothetical protein U0900_12115 [Myxococcota bacterium]
MSLFEYLAIAFSLVISTSVMRIADGLSESARGTERCWVYRGQLGVALAANVAAFWNFWSFHEADWTFPRFVLAVSGPVALYFGTATLVPSDRDAVSSWKEHSRAVRGRFYRSLCAYAVLMAATTTVLLDMGLAHPARAAQLAVFVLGLAGTSTENERAHQALVVVTIAFGIVALSTLAARPGALT